MAEYQKFMFDNFIVECGKNNRSEDEAAVTGEEIQLTETEPESVETPEEVIVTEVEAETPVVEAELPPSPPTFSKEELEAAIIKAKEEGYEKGFQTALGDYEKQQDELLKSIDNRLLAMLVDAENFQKQLELDNLSFVSGALKKYFRLWLPNRPLQSWNYF